ncbi:MAG: DUF4956 domain-containing protein [Lachnospiraceae bacterium]|nr:DUF4956 domain-containing protein [Lachnospiraceae bacterium]
MSVFQFFRPIFVEGYASAEKSVLTMAACLFLALFLGSYTSCIYRRVRRQAFYSRGFQLSLAVLAVITAAIILTIQSNIVVSLGMVGALSIVRFRTAVKDSLDLIFLFWSISTGIICGAGYAMIAILLALIVTAAVLLYDRIREPESGMMLLVVNAGSVDDEETVMEIVRQNTTYLRVQAKSASKKDLNLTIEVKLKEPDILKKLLERPEVVTASLVRHDGEVTV